MRLLILLLSFLMVSCLSNNDKAFVAKMDKEVGSIPQNWPWRGINIVSFQDTKSITQKRIEELKNQGANAIRMTVELRRYLKLHPQLSVEEGIEKNLNWCEKLVQWCAEYDIAVIINMSDFPVDPKKGFNKTSPKFWNSDQERMAALETIALLVERMEKYSNVVAYDFFGEPVVVIKGKSHVPVTWEGFFKNIVDTVRKRSDKYLIYTPGPWGLVKGYKKNFEPFKDDKIIYGFHFYEPHTYTHQGLGERSEEYKYPGKIGFRYWNKKTVEKQMEPALSWAEKNNKLLFVGEFSTVSWAEGRNEYLDDVMTIFEDNNIGYTFWALNGWMGWNPNSQIDYAASMEKGKRILKKSSSDSETMELLEKHWKKIK